MIWVTRYLCHLTAVKSVDRHLNFDPDTGKCRFNKGFYNTEWQCLILSNQSLLTRLRQGQRIRDSIVLARSFGLAWQKTHCPVNKYQQNNFHLKEKRSLSLVQSYKNQRLNEILYAFMYQTAFCSYNLKQAILTCQSGASDVDKVNAVRPSHAPPLSFAPDQLDENFSGLAAVSLVVFDAMPFIYYETSPRKISKPESIHEIQHIGDIPFEWLQKTWASSSTMENFQETLRGLPWSERRT